jgi:hypothetical protein
MINDNSSINLKDLIESNRRTADDFINATNWAKVFGKSWHDYKVSSQCQKIIESLTKKYKPRNSGFIESTRGKGSETWVHPVIAVDFAEWLSPDFGLLVKETFVRVISNDSDLAAQIMINDHNDQRAERAKKRILVSDTNKEVRNLAEKHGIHAGQVHNDRYKGCYGMIAPELRQDAGLKENETPLDSMSIRDLTLQSFINQMVIESDNPNLTFKLANNIRKGIEEATHKPLKPIWEKNKLKPHQAQKVVNNGQLELPL